MTAGGPGVTLLLEEATMLYGSEWLWLLLAIAPAGALGLAVLVHSLVRAVLRVEERFPSAVAVPPASVVSAPVVAVRRRRPRPGHWEMMS